MKTKQTIYELRHSGQQNAMGCTYPQLELEVESSYVEAGELNVLVSQKLSPNENPGDPEPCWTLSPIPRRVSSFVSISVWQPTSNWCCSETQRCANEGAFYEKLPKQFDRFKGSK